MVAESKRIYLSPPDVSSLERDFVLKAIDSNWIAPVGPDLDAFELEIAEWTATPFAIGLTSGTAALHLALVLLDVGPGDEVLVPTMTFVPTANAALYVGATPFFVDSEPSSWCLSPELVRDVLKDRAKKGKLPKAAMTVDLYGQCADYSRLNPIFNEFEIPVIEDAAEALGASRDGEKAGSFGSFGVISLNGNKIVTSSSGGMLLCPDSTTAARARKLASQSRDHAPHYQHSEIGYNYRLSNILAAFGRAQLATLNERMERRKQIRTHYEDTFAGISGVSLSPVPSGSIPNWWMSCITVDPDLAGIDASQIREFMENSNIETRPTWKPLHLQPLFENATSYTDGTAERLFRTGLCLPSGSGLSHEELDRVTSTLLDLFSR
jgi:pyridoxal phosphate-dependent aminotransferase EpsN